MSWLWVLAAAQLALAWALFQLDAESAAVDPRTLGGWRAVGAHAAFRRALGDQPGCEGRLRVEAQSKGPGRGAGRDSRRRDPWRETIVERFWRC